LGIGDWGLGIGPNPQSPIPNPQSPIPTGFNQFLPVGYHLMDSSKNYPDLRVKPNYPYDNIPTHENFFSGGVNLQKDNQDLKFNTGRWSSEEHQKFIEAMFLYGNEWKRVQQHIKTRSSTQARSHAQKFFIRLRKKFLDDGEDLVIANENKIAVRNEKIFSWIKENVNPDSIFKLAKSSGNLLNPGTSSTPGLKLNSNFGVNSSVGTGNNIELPGSYQNSSLPKHYQTELFFTERKDKLCKIILSLISNTSKTKRKNFGKDDLSDDNEDWSRMSMKTLNNNFKQVNENSLQQSGLPELNNYNNLSKLGGINQNNNFTIFNNNNNLNLNNQINNLGNPLNNMNNFSSVNNISSLRHNLIPCKNVHLFENKEEHGLSMNLLNSINPSAPCVRDSGNLTNLNLDFHQKEILNKNNILTQQKNSVNSLGTILSTTDEKKLSGSSIEGSGGSSGPVNMPTSTPTNSNYYNPNMNSYISIVTINLGCNGKNSDENSPTSLLQETPVSKPSNVSYVNKNVNSVNNLIKTPQNSVNSALYQQKLSSLPKDTQNIINKKIEENRQFLNRKRNSERKNSTQGNIVSNTSHLNIVNGNLNTGIIESEKEKEVPLDPFKLTFEESSNTFFEVKEDSDHCNEGNENFDLNLGEYFRTDN
jgi:SHAQKYF class myb-like DNA-binding protein